MPEGPDGEKRPADAIGRAIMVAKIATGEVEQNESRNGEHSIRPFCIDNVFTFLH